jgi:hypothetical protein
VWVEWRAGIGKWGCFWTINMAGGRDDEDEEEEAGAGG